MEEPARNEVLWRRINLAGMERCTLEATPAGHRISGTALFADGDRPVEIRYSVALDAAWFPRVVGVHVTTSAGDRSVALTSDAAGTWEAGGDAVPALDGAVDVDFGWTPATNTIPIRRLGLEVGESAEVTAAYVPFPERAVTVRRQTYERLAERRFRYTSGDFTADLTVDGAGLVTAYPGRWAAVAPR